MTVQTNFSFSNDTSYLLLHAPAVRAPPVEKPLQPGNKITCYQVYPKHCCNGLTCFHFC
jgi:hypothetical protein